MNISESILVDYRYCLQQELNKRIDANPNYSLRAFARDLELTASQLSLVINQKKHLSLEAALKVGKKLKLSETDLDNFLTMVEYSKEKSNIVKEKILKKLKKIFKDYTITKISLEKIEAISEWYHIPIIEMTELKDFEMTPKSIAESLGIQEKQAKLALDRLERLQIIKKDQGTYIKLYEHGLFSTLDTNKALRGFHRKMIGKAIDSLETQSNNEKYVGSRTFSINPHKLPEAFDLTREYLKNMAQLMEQDKDLSEVYHLNVQLFNLTSKGKA